MHLTPSLSRSQAKKAFALLVALLLVTLQPLVSSAAVEWPEGWSRPHVVGRGVLHHEHRTAAAGTDKVWVTMTNVKDASVILNTSLVDVARQKSEAHSSFTVKHKLMSWALISAGGTAYLAWIEREEGERSLMYLVEMEPGASMAPILIWQSAHILNNIDLAVRPDGALCVVWAGMDEGYHSLYLMTVTTKGQVLSEPKRLTSLDNVDRNPKLTIDETGYIHITYSSQGLLDTNMVYQLHEPLNLALVAQVTLGVVPDNTAHVPIPLASGPRQVDIVWQRAAYAPMSLGTLQDGKWIRQLTPIIGTPGRMSSPRAVRSEAGKTMIVWLSDHSGTYQVVAAVLDSQGKIESQGAATITSGNALEPRPLWLSETKVVTYAEVIETGTGKFSLLSDVNPRSTPLSFHLGLNTEQPFGDVLYKYFSLLLGSTLLVFVSFGALILGIVALTILDRLGIFSKSRAGITLRYLTLFTSLLLMKQWGGYIYYGALFIPGWGAYVAWLGAAVFAGSIVWLAQLESDDTITLVLLGFLFMLSDAFTALLVTGVGKW